MATIKALLEKSLADYLAALDVCDNIYTGHSNDDKEAPAIICQCESLEEEPLHSGNYQSALRVMVKSPAADGEEALDEIDSAVRDALWSADAPSGLQVDGLTIFGFSAPHKVDFGIEGDALTATHSIEVYCCGMTFEA